MNHRPSSPSCALAALGLCASLLAACGGRYQTLQQIEGDTTSGGSGSASAGRGGASTVQAGSSSSGTAGASSAGTSSGGNCGSVKCAALACPVNSAPAIQVGECCATCVSTCPATCPSYKCGAGSHLETLPGACCASCVDVSGTACQTGLQAYAMYRQAVLTKYQFGCASDIECVTIAPVNSCENGCNYAQVWYGVADSFETNLSNSADMYCSSCKQGGPTPACAAPPTPRCLDGQCSIIPK